MSLPERFSDQPSVNIRELRYWGIPLGEILANRTEFSSDEKTQRGLVRANEALDKSGMVVLDAHLSSFDIIATGIALSEKLEIKKLVAAVSAHDYNYPIFRKGFFSRMTSLDGIELYPVYRTDDLEDRKRRVVYEKALNSEGIREAVMQYFKRTQEVIHDPHQIVLVSAYNGVNRLGEKLSPGVKRLLKRGYPGLCSYTVFDRKARKFRSFLTEHLLEFSSETEVSEIYSQILSAHKGLIERAESFGLS